MVTFKQFSFCKWAVILIACLLPFAGYPFFTKNTGMPVTSKSDEALTLFIQGREAYEMGRSDDAVILMDKALQKDAGFAAAWLYKAYLSGSEQEWLNNMENANRFRQSVSEGEGILIDLEQARYAGDKDKCLGLASRLVEKYPADARVLIMLASEYHSRGEVNMVRDLAMDAIRSDPESPLGYRTLGASWVLDAPFDFGIAYKYMKGFADLRPGEASAHIALGDVYRANLDLQDAKNCFTKAINIDGESSIAYSKRGYVNTYLGYLDEAREDFATANALKGELPGYNGPNCTLLSYLNAGLPLTPDPGTSIVKAGNKKSIPISGNTDHCYFCCSFISMNYGFFVTPSMKGEEGLCLAREFCRESVPPDPHSMECNFEVVDIFRAIQSQDYEKARLKITHFGDRKLSEVPHRSNEIYNFLMGLVYNAEKKYNSALSSFKKSDTSNMCVKFNMALAYDNLGRFEEAEQLFSELSGCEFADASKTALVRISNSWLKSLAHSRE